MSLASPLEVARSTHEESERYESALASLINSLPSGSSSSSSRSALKTAHLASILADRIVTRNRNLATFYADESGAKKEELQSLASGSGTGNAEASSSASSMDAALNLFQSRLSHIKSYHEKYPAAPPEAFSLDLTALEGLIAPGSTAGASSLSDPLDRLFSGEEGAGRYLDVYEHHSQYINLKGVRRLTYLNYLDKFHDFAAIGGPEVKRQDAYRTYVSSLRQYLISYLRKIRPLDDVDAIVQSAEQTFEDQWQQSTVAGWEDGGKEWAQPLPKKQKEQPEKVTADQAKASVDGGVWCEACQKSFAKQSVFDGHLNGKNHKKAVARLQRESGGGDQTATGAGKVSPTALQAAKTLAKHEFVVRTIATGPLATHRSDTRSNVERRAALTERERQAEAEELARAAEEGDPRERNRRDGPNNAGDDEEEGEGDDKIYNPKKLPLGWDGRPIPVWLYKLHGLGVEFRCEICSDYVYQGRKNFDRHFTESRHAFGMRALGLPNTKHFHGVTSIEDAMHLAEKLRKQGKEGAAANAAGGSSKDIEEVEDENGNTYSRKDYELLKRQGLI